MAITINDLMARMPAAFLPDQAEGVDAVIQYRLNGEEAGDWIITIRDGACTVEEGVSDSPSMTLSADAQDYKDVVTGRTNAMQAFMQGKLKLAGDLNLAMKFMNYFKLS
jgi:putative sterol carrier protein